MIGLCSDIGYTTATKHGEQLCGDHVEWLGFGRDSAVAVLADGLGSGVKACILSTLTAKIIATMMANNMGVEECISTIAATLPTCKVRQLAYSTFTVILINSNCEAELIQYDNPRVMLLRNGVNTPYSQTALTIGDKTICLSKIRLSEDDSLIALSDGAIHAGVGSSLDFGWDLDSIADYAEAIYKPSLSAKVLSAMIVEACVDLYDGKPRDDTSACVVKIRRRKPVNLMIGPPANPSDDRKMLSLFFSKGGEHIVCGGTTAKLAAGFLKTEVDTSNSFYIDSDVPPTAEIRGVDLVTEGVVTISKTLEYAKDYLGDNRMHVKWNYQDDGASKIARLLFAEATDINFYVGRAVNPMHQNPNLPINFNIKMRLVDELSECLQKMGKKIKVGYF
jgi:hypothetical protein